MIWWSFIGIGLIQGDVQLGFRNLDFLGVVYRGRVPVCSGVLYTPIILITAAICFREESRRYFVLPSARLTNYTRKFSYFTDTKDLKGVLSRRVRIKKIEKHPHFNNYGTSAYNVAIVVLKEHTTKYSQTWRLIKFDEFNVGSLSLRDVKLVGWKNSWETSELFGVYGLPPSSSLINKASDICSHPRPEFPEAEFCPIPFQCDPELSEYWFATPLILTTYYPVVIGIKSWSGFCASPYRSESYIRTYAIFDWVESFVNGLS